MIWDFKNCMMVEKSIKFKRVIIDVKSKSFPSYARFAKNDKIKKKLKKNI